ncbi:hypothetical protein BDW02DRAFT_423396 [Decorospora gaudefroyi]|uniref:Uncharacterized protein n=1 Tax=Decorospora gaudefroyi TaxID=184978 RepID=A0A6A5KBD9_9PLEO|nr:hypothetical protein BDW02DRAFT_423396 [Decorospora gaudefroyi]
MTAMTTESTISTPNSKPGTAKKWLQRHLRKVASRQMLRGGGEADGVQRRVSFKRPHTAPSAGGLPILDSAPAVPSVPIDMERVSSRPPVLPPLRPPRPDSGVIRDVNAWLDASMNTSSPPLMGGLSYWRTATVPGVKDSPAAQHAFPLTKAPGTARPSTASGQQAKSFRRCAKMMQVQMPSLLRTKSHRPSSRKQVNRQSASMPVLAISYEDVQPGAAPMIITRSRSLLRPATRQSTLHSSARSNALLSTDQQSREHLPCRQGTPASTRLGETDSVFERRINAMFMRPARSADSTRPSTAAAGLTREDSMGDLSDAPTYVSGPPPPSYRSRPESVLTTSSFGCIDGMNPQQRQISQQRAALQRGMKCRLKKFAHTFII